MELMSALIERAAFPEPGMKEGRETCQHKISVLATDLCRSIPVFFNSSRNSKEDRTGSKPTGKEDFAIRTELKITPKMAAILTWPLKVAVSTEAVPIAQKEWLQCRLKTVANAIRAPVLDPCDR